MKLYDEYSERSDKFKADAHGDYHYITFIERLDRDAYHILKDFLMRTQKLFTILKDDKGQMMIEKQWKKCKSRAAFFTGTISHKIVAKVIELVWTLPPNKLQFCSGWQKRVIDVAIFQFWGIS